MYRKLPVLAGISLLAAALTSSAEMAFTDVTTPAGIHHVHSHPDLSAYDSEHFSWMTGGAVAEDFDGDGWIDLYVLQGGVSANLLYINQGDGTFIDEAAARGLDLTGPHVGVCAADYDRDGDLDIFISNSTGGHHLLLNDGSGMFSDSGQSFPLPQSNATSPSWCDINNDGQLDLALGAWRRLGLGDTKIYRNEGGQLTLVQSLPKDWSFTPAFGDFDNDRFQDLFLVADFTSTSHYRNNGNGLLLPSGTSDVRNGMGVAVGDLDSDGDLDVFITSIKGVEVSGVDWGIGNGNRLLVNNGNGDFADRTDDAGVRDGAWGWGAICDDLDNDGDLDIYHVNGWPDASPAAESLFNNTPARLFENLGNNEFRDIAAAAGDAANTGQGRCVVAFDYDNDGDQDLFIANNSVLTIDGDSHTREPGPPVLLRNDTSIHNHWLKVHFRGIGAPHHTHGLGARLYATTGTLTQMRELNASSGYLGHGPNRIAHFGLGPAVTCDRVRAAWTNGDETEWRNVAADQTITLSSPRATLSRREIDPGEPLTFGIEPALLPPGASASWRIADQVFPNPATVSLSAPGEHALVLTISDGGDPSTFLWSETLRFKVRDPNTTGNSIARLWNEEILAAIRLDFPNPTVHARNLFHLSVAMWDAWAAFDPVASGVIFHEKFEGAALPALRHEAISYAAYRILADRYASSRNASSTLASLADALTSLGYAPGNHETAGPSPAALGNRIAQSILSYYSNDNADQPDSFLDGPYLPSNPPLPVTQSGTIMTDPNRWQPLQFLVATTQNGQTASLTQSALGSHWGAVRPFALPSLGPHPIHLDPGPPPLLGGLTDAAFKEGNTQVLRFSSLLDSSASLPIDISPASRGANTLGQNDGTGYPANPVTGLPYLPTVVNHADYARVLAEYWADGPASETPPGHWNKFANQIADSPLLVRRIAGVGPVTDPLEWDVKTYLALNGALHDAAIAAWACKRYYDSARPISSIRHMGTLGQSTDPALASYHPLGLPLVPDLIEIITPDSSAPGQRHAHLADQPGKIAVRCWTPKQSPPGVHWILAIDWLPYQRATFVTPAFPGYVSGHSTFSRAAAEVLTNLTGSPYFPGGVGTFTARAGEFLEFDSGPATDVILQWASYYDAADEAGLSRIYGGIHVPADDGPGRIIGSQCGIAAWDLARKYYDGSITRILPRVSIASELQWTAVRGLVYKVQSSAGLDHESFTDQTPWRRAEETLFTHPLPNVPRQFFRILQTSHSP